MRLTFPLLIGVTALGQQAAATPLTSLRCKVNFDFDSVRYDESDLSACVEEARTSGSPTVISIFATATRPGTQDYNRVLSEKRAKSLAKVIGERFPEAVVEAQGGGVHPRGRQAEILVLLAPKDSEVSETLPAVSLQTPPTAASIPSPSSPRFASLGSAGFQNAHVAIGDSPAGNKKFRIAFTGAIANFDGKDSYPAAGAEVAWLPTTGRFYSDIGAGFTEYTANEIADLYRTSVFATLGVKWNYLVLAGRGAAGVLSTSNAFSTNIAGSGRIGLDRDAWSVFAWGEASEHLRSFGLDIGIKF